LHDTLTVIRVIGSGRMTCVAHVGRRRKIIQEYMQIRPKSLVSDSLLLGSEREFEGNLKIKS
jgi:hypothetical protein